eukprot:3925534-Amphidinium_carterae.1
MASSTNSLENHTGNLVGRRALNYWACLRLFAPRASHVTKAACETKLGRGELLFKPFAILLGYEPSKGDTKPPSSRCTS